MKRNREQMPIAVVDIDGTIAKVGARAALLLSEPIDWEKFYADEFDDEPIRSVCDMVMHLARRYEIIFCTSRKERVRQKTQLWILKHLGMTPDDYHLIMRPDDDERPDYLQKIACFQDDTTEKERQRVALILDDSIEVALEWKRLGYTVLKAL